MKFTAIHATCGFATTDQPFPEDFVWYQSFVAKLAKPMGSETLDILHAAVGVSGEAGELLDAVKKNWAYNKPLDRENIVEELGDLRFYMQHLMNVLKITEAEVIEHNMRKLQKRYANGYSDKAAQERADKVESEDAAAEFEAMSPFATPTPVDDEQGLLKSDMAALELRLTAVPFGHQLDKRDPDWSAS